jgi:signal transduction histidine kinase
LTTAFEFSQEIAVQLELACLLDSVTDRARTLMAGLAAALCLLDETAANLRLAASSGSGDSNPDLRQPISESLPSQVIGAGRTVLTSTACSSCGFLRRSPGSQCVATPLQAGTAMLGALCVVRPEAATFEKEEQAALALLANAAAVAIVNARLVAASRTQAELSASQAERERLAAELHDNLAQTLSFLILKADQLEILVAAGDKRQAATVLADMRGATNRAYGQVRAALTGLSTAQAAGSTLADDLRACVAEVQAATGMPIQPAIVGDSDLAVSHLAHQQVLHIVREALLNAWRHAGATMVKVEAALVGDMVQITVYDDGCGFDPATVEATGHLGLAIMRARAERSGGQFSVDTHPGGDTTVTIQYARCEEQRNESLATAAGR